MSGILLRNLRPIGVPNRSESEVLDLRIEDGVLRAVGRNLPAAPGLLERDFSGCCVSSGWTDIHVHIYFGATDISIRAAEAGLKTGVTTLVDCGSAGEANFSGFAEYVAQAARERIYAFLNIGSIGLVACNRISELSLGFRSVDIIRTLEAARSHPDLIKGIKCRASHVISGDLGASVVTVARKAARVAGVPLVVHVGEPPPLLEEVLDLLEGGDVVTHAFNGKPGGNLMEDRRALESVHAARERGVLLDVGHGSASFSFEVMRFALEQGITPDMISSDLHGHSIVGPAFDLPTTMSKILNLGVSLEKVIQAVTEKPAELLRLEPPGLRVGGLANLTVFSVEPLGREVQDAQGGTLLLERFITPRFAVLGEQQQECSSRFLSSASGVPEGASRPSM
ncbi:MAG: amidohydrolase/deacetylase family metallohydrolase [bacterium]